MQYIVPSAAVTTLLVIFLPEPSVINRLPLCVSTSAFATALPDTSIKMPSAFSLALATTVLSASFVSTGPVTVGAVGCGCEVSEGFSGCGVTDGVSGTDGVWVPELPEALPELPEPLPELLEPPFTFVKFNLTKVFLFYLEGKLNLYAERGNDMLGEQIKKLRLANDLSQTQLAHALSVTKQSVSNWENDNILPSVDLLKRIALYFSCTTDYLLELEEEGSRILIEVDDLTIQQAAHIQRIIHDFQIVNRQLKNSSP